MNKTKKSIFNFVVSIIYKLFVMGIGLIIPRLFILNYGSNLNGFQSSVSQIFAYIALIEAGVGEATLQAIYKPIAERNHQGTNAVLAATTKYYNKIGLAYFGILTLMGIVYPLFVNVPELAMWQVFIYILISGTTSGVNFFYAAKVGIVVNAEGDSYWTSIFQFGVYILTSASKIFCILRGYNIILIQFCYFTINMLYTLVLFAFAKKRYPWLNFKTEPNYKAIEQKDSVLIHKISGIVFQNTDILILTFFCDLNTVSIYTIYKLVINSITSIIATLTGSVNFALGQTFATDKEKYKEKIDVFNILYTTIAFALITVAFILYTPFIKLYTNGSDINYVDKWLPLLFVLVEILMFGREAMMLTITVAGHFKQTLSRSLVESAINLTTSLIMVQFIGIYGVLLGTIVALLYRTIDINIYANKRILNRSSFTTFRIWITNTVLFVLIWLLTSSLNLSWISNYASFIIVAVIITCVCFICFAVLNITLNYSKMKGIIKYIPKIKSFKK